MTTVGRRQDFGRDWNEVVNDWCLGFSLPISDDKAWEALGVLENLWPAYLGVVLTQGRRGYFAMAHVIDDGLTLAACQHLEGFDEVLKRIKQGEQAAFAEMRFAATLVDFGYQPVLDKEHHGKRPDSLIICDNSEIFIDVILPEMSADTKKAESLAENLSQTLLQKLVNQTKPSRFEVYLLAPNSPDIDDEIDHYLDTHELSASETVHRISDIAHVKYSEVTDSRNVGPTIFAETDFPAIGVGRAFVTNNIVNMVTVRIPFTDDRLELLMRHKRDQFSEDEINLMVIDLSGVPHGSKRWPALARRRLQPNLNRRFSGIVLFYRYLDLNTGAFIRTCDVEMHPNPYRNIPSRLLNELVSLNQAPATF